ncbi:MAG: hypothetical protein EA397_04580 [Deltaproteobacteria bacterium]|nr:MAG: hypothetical protein EA397_04580 [Deltaproteobacteria bacterium]
MSRSATALALFFSLGATTPAFAEQEPVEGLAWNWNDVERRYHIQGSIFVPDWVWVRALNNLEVRANELHIELVATCEATEPHKKRWNVDCNIDAVGLQVAALPRDARRKNETDSSRLDRILEEWKERLTDSTVRMQWRDNGRIRSINLPDLNRMNRRDGENIEIFRQIMVRTFSPLEIELPKKATDKGDRTWTEKQPLIAGFLTDAGSVGNVPTIHQIDAQRGSQVRIASSGKGTVGNAGRTRNVGGQSEIADHFNVEFNTETFFDTEAGHIVRRQVIFGGNPTASSAIADGTAGLPYLQSYKVQLIAADVEPPIVMPTKEVEPSLGGPSAVQQPRPMGAAGEPGGATVPSPVPAAGTSIPDPDAPSPEPPVIDISEPPIVEPDVR